MHLSVLIVWWSFYYSCNQCGHAKLDDSLYKHLGTWYMKIALNKCSIFFKGGCRFWIFLCQGIKIISIVLERFEVNLLLHLLLFVNSM